MQCINTHMMPFNFNFLDIVIPRICPEILPRGRDREMKILPFNLIEETRILPGYYREMTRLS